MFNHQFNNNEASIGQVEQIKIAASSKMAITNVGCVATFHC